MTLQSLKDNCRDEPTLHQQIHESFIEHVNNDDQLNSHRTFVEQNIWGFGERSFHWLWKMVVDDLPNNFMFLEVGCFKGQVLSLIRLLADRENKTCFVSGITPLDSTGIEWESDYAADIATIHDKFNLRHPIIHKGRSDNPDIIKTVSEFLYDCIYVDGDHSKEGAYGDLKTYSPLIKSGGYLVVDDAACRTNQPFGYFQGIQSVCDALEDWEKEQTDFEFCFNVVHIMVYKRK